MRDLTLVPLLILGGAAILIFGSPHAGFFPTNGNLIYCVILCITFLVLSIFIKDSRSLNRCWSSACALFIASAATLLLSTRIFNLSRTGLEPVPDIAVDKVSQMLHGVPVILLLTLIAGDDLKRIFFQRGKWRPVLIFGADSFLVFGVIAFFPSIYPGGFIFSLPAATLWMIAFTFSNAIMEEQWFRGIFLRKYKHLAGKQSAITATALVIGATHLNTTRAFPGSGWIFGLVVSVLDWIGAEAMYKCASLIAPILFHVANDLVVIVPVLNSGQDFQEGNAQCTNQTPTKTFLSTLHLPSKYSCWSSSHSGNGCLMPPCRLVGSSMR